MSRPEVVSGQTIRLTAAFTCRSCGRDVSGAKVYIEPMDDDGDGPTYWVNTNCPECGARHEFYSDANTVE